jgi:repressor LexA
MVGDMSIWESRRKMLTGLKKDVYQYIKYYYTENDNMPTIREIAESLNISRSTVPYLLRSLDEMNYIELTPNIARGIRLIDRESEQLRSIPLVGTIRAGYPVFAPENYVGSIKISADFVPKGTLFALKVRGDSMSGINIQENDIAVVKRDIDPTNGDIVAALIGDEATLKKFYRSDEIVWLMPENPEYKPIVITEESKEFEILGKLVLIIRKY